MTAPTIRNQSGWGAFQTPCQNTLPQPVVGNFIVVFIAATSAITSSMTDSAGNTYTAITHISDANSNTISLYTAPVTASGSGTLTITESATGGSMIAIEVQNVSGSTPSDGTGTGTYNSSAGGLCSTSSISTTFATDLILSALYDQNNQVVTANSGTLIATASEGGDTAIAQQRTTSSTSSYTESFTIPASTGETAAMVAIAIKGLSSGGASFPLPSMLFVMP
jgi:hypothetical protein